MKLAALGAPDGKYCHEIRNPLSAINHAGELLQEEDLGPSSERLLRIVLDNTQRVERIVSDVLGLGRRDRTHRELIDLRQSLPVLVDEFSLKEKCCPVWSSANFQAWPSYISIVRIFISVVEFAGQRLTLTKSRRQYSLAGSQ